MQYSPLFLIIDKTFASVVLIAQVDNPPVLFYNISVQNLPRIIRRE